MPDEKHDDKDKSDDKRGEEKHEEQFVQLDAKTYDALLDKIDELEEQVKGSKGKGGEDEDDIERLAREGKRGGEEDRGKLPDLDSLSNTELARFISSSLAEEVISPLLVSIEEIKISNELDRMQRNEATKDVMDFSGEIFEICSKNPEMSIQRAYKLAKAEKGEKKDKGEGKGDKKARDERLRHLPKRSTFSEKPSGFSEKVAGEGEPKTLDDAAQKGWDEAMEGKG